MIKNKSFKIIFVVVVLISCLISILQMIWKRPGPFGIGLPAPMEERQGPHFNFSIKLPKDWSLIETPDGSHGDKDIIAVILPSGRSFPQVIIYSREFPDEDRTQLLAWGENKADAKTGYKQISLTTFKTSRYSGEVRNYSLLIERTIPPPRAILCNQYQFFDENIGYILACCADEKDWP